MDFFILLVVVFTAVCLLCGFIIIAHFWVCIHRSEDKQASVCYPAYSYEVGGVITPRRK